MGGLELVRGSLESHTSAGPVTPPQLMSPVDNTHTHTHTQELKTGLSENSVFNVFHPDAVDLFSVCSSLEKV